MDYDYKMKKIVLITLLVIALLATGVGIFLMSKKDDVSPVVQSSTQNKMMSIENYVRTYISELSPVEEVLGGRFYVTDIKTGNGKGKVSYEDGHSAYIADFTYSNESNGAIRIDSFVITVYKD